MKYMIMGLFALMTTLNLEACVNYNPVTNTYTVDQYGYIDTKTSKKDPPVYPATKNIGDIKMNPKSLCPIKPHPLD